MRLRCRGRLQLQPLVRLSTMSMASGIVAARTRSADHLPVLALSDRDESPEGRSQTASHKPLEPSALRAKCHPRLISFLRQQFFRRTYRGRLIAVRPANRFDWIPERRIGDVRAIPRKQVIHAVDRRDGNMQRVHRRPLRQGHLCYPLEVKRRRPQRVTKQAGTAFSKAATPASVTGEAPRRRYSSFLRWANSFRPTSVIFDESTFR
jgi:hypothetical protein